MEAFIWFALLIVFVAVEAATVNMVSTWFALGSLAALIIALIGGELWLQVLVFLTVSAVALALLRPLAKKYFTPRITRTNVDALVGKTCILPLVGREIPIVEWTARSTTGEPISVGEQVKIDRVEGVKVYVTPVAVTVK